MPDITVTDDDFKLLFELSMDMLCIAGTDGYLKKVNASFESTLGYENGELLSKPFMDFVHPDDVQSTLDQFEKVRAGIPAINFENRYRHKDGSYLVLSWSTYSSPNTGKVYGVARNVTEEKNTNNQSTQIQNVLNAETIVAITDKVGTIIEVNDRFCDISGYSRDELIGQNHRLVNSGVHPKTFFQEMWQTISSGKPWSGLIENRRKDGSHYVVLSIITPIFDLDGAISHYLAIRQDMTDYMDVQKKYTETLGILNETSAIAKVGGWKLDIATEELIWTDETFRILEVEKKEDQRPVLPEGLNLFTDEYKSVIEQAVMRAIEFGEPYSLELMAQTAKGNVLWVYTNGKPNYEDGKIVSLSGTIQDINDRKLAEIERERAEDELRESETRYRSLYTSTTQGVVYQDRDGQITDANPAAERILGLSLSQMQGKTSSDPRWKAIHEDGTVFTAETHPAMLALTTGKSVLGIPMGVYVPEKDEYRWITIDAIPQYKEGEDTPYQAFTTFSDVTEAKRVAATLREAKNLAEQANLAKSTLLTNMSHELRTPLNAIIGFSQTMNSEVLGPLGNARYKEYTRDIQQSGQHLLDLINDILDVSAIEAGALDLQKEETELTDIVQASSRLLRQQAEGKGITLSTELEASIPSILVDQRRIKQVFLNLLSNAIKFTPHGGEVVTSAVLAEDGFLAITVRDTGIGMSKDEVDLALSKFGQVDSGFNRKHEGTGLGLPLTIGLIELHGGALEIDSKVGVGTSVTVTFPKSCIV